MMRLEKKKKKTKLTAHCVQNALRNEPGQGQGTSQKVTTVVQKRDSSGVGKSVTEGKLMDWKHCQQTLLTLA